MDERDKRVCQMYKEGLNILEIAKRNDISHSTIYRIIKREGIPLRTEVNQAKQQHAIEKICWYFDNSYTLEDITEKTGVTIKTVVGILKKYRAEEYRRYDVRKKLERKRKEQEEMLSRKRESAQNSRVGHLSGFLDRQEEKFIKWEEEHGVEYGIKGIQTIIDSVRIPTSEDQRNILIAEDYSKGLSIKEILEKYEISQKEFYNTFERAKNSKPGYFPNRPPLVD